MHVTFWGVRGAIPAPGLEFNRYGGNTPCISVRHGDELFVLDAGTGITVLGRELMAQSFGRGEGSATILLTHAHWDHIQGFPFFPPVMVAGNRFVIYGPSDSPAMVEGILEGQMNPHFSPVQTLRNLGAAIEFRAVKEGEPLHVGGLTITARSVPHGRIRALAYRIERGAGDAQGEGGSLVFVPDAGYPGGEPEAEVLELYRGATCLIHDCTYTPEDQQQRQARGYSSIAVAARVAARCAVRQLVMFHYDQDYTDEQVDRLAQRCRALLDAEPGGRDVELVPAAEGLVIDV